MGGATGLFAASISCTIALIGLAGVPSLAAAGAQPEKIAFADWGGLGRGIYTVGADGTGLRRLSDGTWPAWSPNGRRIAFQGGLGDGALYVMNADGSRQLRLVARGALPAWSPDGRQIAFFTHYRGGTSIYVINADRSGRRLLVRNGAAPAWSPDGKRIAFVGSGSPDGIYVVDANGGERRLLRRTSGWAPAWSPDGTRIAFLGTDRYYVMHSDGSGLHRLPHRFEHKNQDCNLAWSPDGKQIAVTPRLLGGVYVMHADGTDLVELPGTGHACGVAWQRLR